MSTIGGGASASEFDKLIALAQFVQTDQYLPRVRELRELEAAASKTAQEAMDALNLKQEQSKVLAEQQAKLDADVAAFRAERDEQREETTRHEAELAMRFSRVTAREKALETATTDLQRDKASWMSSKTRMETELARREAAVRNKERELAQDEAALRRRIAKIKAATDE